MTNNEPVPADLEPTAFLDLDEPKVAAFADEATAGARDATDRAVRLYYAVRDRIRYDPYTIELSVRGLSASRCVERGVGWCVSKAALLAAVARHAGIPARVGYADVKNHIATERLTEQMGTDVFYWHGYTALYLEGRWVKATPAFNIGLCEKFGIRPLEFDGSDDSLFHPFDQEGRRHMEYLNDRGSFDDVPLEAIMETFREVYPRIVAGQTAGDFAAEAEAERRAAGQAG
ncbi:transglutaminase-like domain-containing protein [Oceanibacterium hippocampi]|uniref:Transglutaminase-like superfamily protein n=1 Tax=Oceanibacterium hippocampi TaxID=745714 RepID=A0A1Y5STV9_9PROT|nr:transglutaminase family protein [Oceanibacterium hippocampi]SLN46826.1 Transglutaminase-like superfamily protein [Oceanibacterium hippocampi]